MGMKSFSFGKLIFHQKYQKILDNFSFGGRGERVVWGGGCESRAKQVGQFGPYPNIERLHCSSFSMIVQKAR